MENDFAQYKTAVLQITDSASKAIGSLPEAYAKLFSGSGYGQTFLNGEVIMPRMLKMIKWTIIQIGQWCLKHEGLAEKAEKIFLARNEMSGGSWRDVGLRGALIEIHAKLSRLINKDKTEDNLFDLFNYCCICLMSISDNVIHVAQRLKPAIVTGCHQGGLGEMLYKTLSINGYAVYDISLRHRETTAYDQDFFHKSMIRILKNISKSYIDGHLDISYPAVIINNFGINKLGWIGTLGKEHFDIIDKNLKWPLMVVDALVRNYQPASPIYRSIRIINISSQTYRVAQRCTSAYCASKAGLSHLTKVMARELAPTVIVNAIAPGLIEDTEMSHRTNQQVLDLRGWGGNQAEKYAKSLVPMHRWTTREEVAEAVLKLINMPDYVTGHTLDMTGGQ